MLKEKIINERYPHTVVITRTNISDDPFEDETTVTELYNGAARCYTDTTTTGGDVVMQNRRKMSIPVRFDEWEQAILAGDKVLATIGNYTENWVVVDFEPDNNRTVVYCEMIRE